MQWNAPPHPALSHEPGRRSPTRRDSTDLKPQRAGSEIGAPIARFMVPMCDAGTPRPNTPHPACGHPLPSSERGEGWGEGCAFGFMAGEQVRKEQGASHEPPVERRLEEADPNSRPSRRLPPEGRVPAYGDKAPESFSFSPSEGEKAGLRGSLDGIDTV